MVVIGAISFLVTKLVAYSGWCWVALRIFRVQPQASSLRRAAVLALVRLGLGLGLGWLLVFVLSVVAPGQNRLGLSLPLLVVGFVALRWLEWSYVGALARGQAKSLRAILLGTEVKEHLWRVGGVVVSFATDLTGVFGVSSLGLIPC
jgi:hypothetical protein